MSNAKLLVLGMTTFCLCFFSCKKEALLTGISDTIVLDFGKAVDLPSANLNLLFEEVIEESRCPTGVVCIHAGRALVQISATPTSLTLPSSAKISLEVNEKDTLGNIIFTLLEVNPYPKEGSPVPDDQKQLKLQVETI